MNDSGSIRQQIVEKIKSSSNILVTVGKSPSVDELSAALGLTALLNKLNKHATAVVSGEMPAAIKFLEPGKTFENTVDSLRDFIIALDKEKADHLRYKVEGDVVKIFITPYKTTISENDLDFSQGDYNVELVLALGVKDEAHLDTALEAHGRILHDATVVTLTSGDDTSDLGALSWHESGASSISEMLVSLSEALKSDKPLLDEQVSTAFLTGIVAATDRFSNSKTSSKVMTMAAQLMAAGANQQLIAAKLSDAHAISSNDTDAVNTDGTMNLSEDTSTKIDVESQVASTKKSTNEEKSDDGSLNIAHEPQGTLDEVAKEVQQDNADQATEKAEDALAKQLDSVAPATVGSPTLADMQKDIASASVEDDVQSMTDSSMTVHEPMLGGTLNATTEQAADEKRAEEKNQQNHTLLSHAGSSTPSQNSGSVFVPPPFSAATTPTVSPLNKEPLLQELPPLPPLYSSPQSSPAASTPTLAEIDSANRVTVPEGDALAAVHAAFDGDSSSLSQTNSVNQSSQPVTSESVNMPSLSNLPPLPDFSTLPPPPAPPIDPFTPNQSDNLGQIFPSPDPGVPAAPVVSNDPGQFKIPGQN
jgi:hypothetical protein